MFAERYKNTLLIFHIILGIVIWIYPFLSTFLGLLIIIIGTIMILNNRINQDALPLYYSGYIIGIEVLLRMAKASLFWEFGKYAVIYFLLLGMVRKQNKIKINPLIFIYFLLLLPSIIMLPIDSFSEWRQNLAFNLSGPACLFISSIYFYNNKISKVNLLNMLFYAVLPILTMSILIILRMPDFASYHFLPHSDPTTSGGYGPNQVSSIFGFGIACLMFPQVLGTKLFSSKFLDLLLLALFFGLGLITFSRGGIFSALIAFTIAVSYYFFQGQKKILIIFKGFLLLVAVTITWIGVTTITNGVIVQRYGFFSETYGEKFILDLTGRALIYEIDLQIFKDNIFTGIGPGKANKARQIYGYGKTVAAHTEYSRILAEHGFMGLISLLILLASPFMQILSNKYFLNKFTMLLFGTLVLFSMSHSAMRLAMPGFIYGLIFINIKSDSSKQ